MKPEVTATTHVLPFNRLSPNDFERLCLWLVQREGFEKPEHVGAAGNEQGRDVIAIRNGKTWVFQCKRVQSFGPTDAVKELDKILSLSPVEFPRTVVFIVTCNISNKTRQRSKEYVANEFDCEFWALTELDEKVKRNSDILSEFFELADGFMAVDAKIDEIRQKLGQNTIESYDDLLKKSCEQSNCNQHQKAYETARQVTGPPFLYQLL